MWLSCYLFKLSVEIKFNSKQVSVNVLLQMHVHDDLWIILKQGVCINGLFLYMYAAWIDKKKPEEVLPSWSSLWLMCFGTKFY